ncbi:Slit 1 protein [Amphibalanus amphitrite]|uniref:Slit 1 protein n=1 Tax=Amphibalanus amphitrite TaxID=1232801 RepID=A0A6A4WNN3_AMPAM|nr:Slit 1 protein [Amphibalanus amphitrite]
MLPPALGKISKKPTSDKKNILRSYTKETSTKTTAGSTIKFDDTDEDDDDYLDDEDYDEDYYDDDYDYLDDDTVYDTDHTGCPTPFLARCQCGDMNHLGEIKFVVNCTNTGFTNASMLGALPDDTEVLIFTGNFLEVLPTNVFGTMAKFEDLEYIDMSNNGIKEIKGKSFHRVSNVKTLILNHNDLYIVEKKHHPRVFSNFDNLEALHLTNAFTEKVDSKWYMLDQMVVKNPSFSVKLIGNPFVCDCDIRPFYQWMRTTRVELLRSADYRCFEGRPASNENLPILELQTTECEPAPAARTSASSVVLGILVFVMCVLLVVVLYMHRHRLVQRAKRLQPHMQVAIRNLKRSRQYANIQHEDAPEVEV